MADSPERRYRGGMAATAALRSPSALSLATAWVLALASEVGWSVGLFNYDGKMGDTPPPVSETAVWAISVAIVLVAVAWVTWRLRRPVRTGFWVFLVEAFAVKGLLLAGLEELWVLLYGAAPFTLAGSYRGEALFVATALVSGVAVALIVRAIDARLTSATGLVAANFD